MLGTLLKSPGYLGMRDLRLDCLHTPLRCLEQLPRSLHVRTA